MMKQIKKYLFIKQTPFRVHLSQNQCSNLEKFVPLKLPGVRGLISDLETNSMDLSLSHEHGN